MKFIITESQHNKLWVLRRYDLVRYEFEETINFINPCEFYNFDLYKSYFLNILMDSLHPEYYLIDNFDYHGIKEVLKDLFYVELTEHYYDKKTKCL